MRRILYISLLLTALTSCNDAFLDRLPETSLVTDNFFKSPSDLELFVNKLYLSENPIYWDLGTDNVVASEKTEILDLLHGNITPATVGGWSWSQIRELNYFLDNSKKVTGDQQLIDHYVGIVRALRAREYYEKIKRYNDVPWYDHALKDTEYDELYKSQDSRTYVVDKIMEDLDFAIEHIMPDLANRTVYSKWWAYGLKARIALHEGTFRKYHNELHLTSTADKYLQMAIDAAEHIMDNTNDFGIYMDEGPKHAYRKLFISNDLGKCKEIIMFKDFNLDAQIKHYASNHVFSYTTNLSKSLMDSYLCVVDGKPVPFSSIFGYQTKNFCETFVDRDPRYEQTFMYPGYVRPGDALPFVPNLNLGGYPQIKFVSEDPSQIAPGTSYNDLPLMRLGEILLIYAESKAELGTLTQNDLDISINLLRDRVGMPHMILSELKVDPLLEIEYPNVSGNQKNAILEIRRERRVELACEGFRLDDVIRWKVGKLLEMSQGVYISKLNQPFDVTGDGKPDVGVYLNSSLVPESDKELICYYLENGNGEKSSISLSKGDHGYIILTNDVTNPKIFMEPKYYYFPLPQSERLTNPNLLETVFW